MTDEGYLVRLCDTISYIGRDIEDAITLGILRRGQLPRNAVNTLGDTNGKIVYRLVDDLIETSRRQGRLGLSAETAQALTELKNFNRAGIYNCPRVKSEAAKIRNLYRLLFEDGLKGLNSGRPGPPLAGFVKSLEPGYLRDNPSGLIVRDFIAGMTDAYFLRLADELLRPRRRVWPG